MSVAVGEEIPVFTRTTGFANWNRYAAVNDEFVPIHMDDDAGRAAGMAGAFGMGNLQWAYLHNVVRDWLGDRGRIVRMDCQFRAVNIKGQIVSAHGRVESVRERADELLVELRVWTEDQDGNQLAPGTCTVVVNR